MTLSKINKWVLFYHYPCFGTMPGCDLQEKETLSVIRFEQREEILRFRETFRKRGALFSSLMEEWDIETCYQRSTSTTSFDPIHSRINPIDAYDPSAIYAPKVNWKTIGTYPDLTEFILIASINHLGIEPSPTVHYIKFIVSHDRILSITPGCSRIDSIQQNYLQVTPLIREATPESQIPTARPRISDGLLSFLDRIK